MISILYKRVNGFDIYIVQKSIVYVIFFVLIRKRLKIALARVYKFKPPKAVENAARQLEKA